MKFRLVILIFLHFLGTASLSAAPQSVTEQIELTIREDMEQFIATQAATFGRKVEYSISRLDPRLNFPICTTPPVTDFNQTEIQPRVSVKVTCSGEHPWSIYVPVQMQAWQEVVVAATSLQRGQILSPSDLTLSEVELSGLRYGFLSTVNEAAGSEIRRNLQPGEPVYPGILDAPRVIQKGDDVIINARTTVMTVQVPGTAMNDGRIGEQINVRNTGSQRVIKATVIAQGQVEVNI